jgi:hypothetical protein
MRGKKEDRWLFFLVVPFVCMLSIHFIIPVSFVLNSYPAFQDTYLMQQFQLEQTTIRSGTMLMQKIASRFLGSFANK